MDKLWTDEVIIETAWKNVMTKLVQEWEGVILWVRIQRRNLISSQVSRDYFLVDRDVNSQRRLSCYSWRSPFKSKRDQHSEREPSAHLHISFTDRQLPLSRS